MLGDGLAVAVGAVHDLDAILAAVLEIDVVCPDGVAYDELPIVVLTVSGQAGLLSPCFFDFFLISLLNCSLYGASDTSNLATPTPVLEYIPSSISPHELATTPCTKHKQYDAEEREKKEEGLPRPHLPSLI